MVVSSRRLLTVFLLFLPAGCETPPAHAPDAGSRTSNWLAVHPGGETTCAFDTPFEFWVRDGDGSRILLYLQGGGGCWDFESCHPDRELQFSPHIDATGFAQRVHGIFDMAVPENPFRDDLAIFVPYCTGDLHLGARRVEYVPPEGESADAITVNHFGWMNVQAVLSYLATLESSPERITVIGGSAGAVASPAVAAQVADLFPQAEVRQVGDGVAGLRLDGSRRMLATWGADSVLASRGLPLPPEGDPFVGMYRAAAKRHPSIRFSQVATTEDRRVSEILTLLGEDAGQLPTLIARSYGEIGAAVSCFSGYTLAGVEHTIMWRPTFFTTTVGGEPLPRVLKRDVLQAPCTGEG